ncbi:hypothetical protein VP01_4060g1 [Puccinia sorghi]|uniref:Uncharacterized protein n=1 Tax=Puccinia sorghi TaxID=27349 RepID=A0A0L6URJ6_9BASI|nr:hypothetical protein VP01_4060g1 [Puccinia sorghi]
MKQGIDVNKGAEKGKALWEKMVEENPVVEMMPSLFKIFLILILSCASLLVRMRGFEGILESNKDEEETEGMVEDIPGTWTSHAFKTDLLSIKESKFHNERITENQTTELLSEGLEGFLTKAELGLFDKILKGLSEHLHGLPHVIPIIEYDVVQDNIIILATSEKNFNNLLLEESPGFSIFSHSWSYFLSLHIFSYNFHKNKSKKKRIINKFIIYDSSQSNIYPECQIVAVIIYLFIIIIIIIIVVVIVFFSSLNFSLSYWKKIQHLTVVTTVFLKKKKSIQYNTIKLLQQASLVHYKKKRTEVGWCSQQEVFVFKRKEKVTTLLPAS